MSNLNIKFQYDGKTIVVQCKETDKINEVFAKFCNKMALKNKSLKFYYNACEIVPSNKSIYALNIKNYDFVVVDVAYVKGA